ncbi:hypothetical protein IAT38_001996 [Cryptococcus sp. DSM 104549]
MSPAEPPPAAASASEVPASPIQHPLDTAASQTPNPQEPPSPSVPKVHIRALVISGQSHVFSFEPEITVGRLKELIWSSWPAEWTDPAQPPSPSFLRIIHSGRILQDDSSLTANNLPLIASNVPPTVVHISVRSFSIRGDDAEPKKPAAIARSSSAVRTRSHTAAEDDVSGCRCIIM